MSFNRKPEKMENPSPVLQSNFVWIFNPGNKIEIGLASGVFLTKEKAQNWVEKTGVEGLLTPFPVDTSAYDWSVKNKFFIPDGPDEISPEFKAKFTLTHYHEYPGWVEKKIASSSNIANLNVNIPNGPENISEEEPGKILTYPEVWVFVASSSRRTGLGSAVFRSKRKAENWLKKNKLDGLLTAYPVGISAYEWSVQNNWFTPKKPHEFTPDFMGRFSGGHKHEHYYNEDYSEPSQLK